MIAQVDHDATAWFTFAAVGDLERSYGDVDRERGLEMNGPHVAPSSHSVVRKSSMAVGLDESVLVKPTGWPNSRKSQRNLSE